MTKQVNDIVAEIGANLGSPQIVADIDRAVAALIGLRKVAVSLHGEPESVGSVPNRASADPVKPQNSLTFLVLADLYRADKSFLDRRFTTRQHYLTVIKQLELECGSRRIGDLYSDDIQSLYDGWVSGRGASMAHTMIGIFRVIIYFGATTLRDGDCQRVSVILHRMRFAQPKGSAEMLTAAQADAIRAEVRRLNRPSIALAQALQYDCELSQIDVIGTWVPESEPGDSDIHYNGNKWMYGIRWEEIDDKFVLRHVTSKQNAEVVIDLNSAPRVVEELRIAQGSSAPLLRDRFPASGPVIWCESTEMPWMPGEFRRYWRKAANLAGVPSTVKNGTSARGSRAATAEDAGSGNVREEGRAEVRH